MAVKLINMKLHVEDRRQRREVGGGGGGGVTRIIHHKGIIFFVFINDLLLALFPKLCPSGIFYYKPPTVA